jgi:hypothetical protein
MNIVTSSLQDGSTLRLLAKCVSGSCPTVWVADSDLAGTTTAVVQGYVVSPERAGIDLPEGELLVEVPISLLTEAVRNLNERQRHQDDPREA